MIELTRFAGTIARRDARGATWVLPLGERREIRIAGAEAVPVGTKVAFTLLSDEAVLAGGGSGDFRGINDGLVGNPWTGRGGRWDI